jgi:hypothetical protein
MLLEGIVRIMELGAWGFREKRREGWKSLVYSTQIVFNLCILNKTVQILVVHSINIGKMFFI